MAAMRTAEETRRADVDRKDCLLPLRIKGLSAFGASEWVGHDESCGNNEKDCRKDDQERNKNISRYLILLGPPIDGAGGKQKQERNDGYAEEKLLFHANVTSATRTTRFLP